MYRIVIVILMYHRHKPIDLIYGLYLVIRNSVSVTQIKSDQIQQAQ
jgi:hypothetical protein